MEYRVHVITIERKTQSQQYFLSHQVINKNRQKEVSNINSFVSSQGPLQYKICKQVFLGMMLYKKKYGIE